MANVGGVIFGSNQPASTDDADGTTYCMGTRFSSDVDGNIPQIHWRVPTNSPGGTNAGVLPIQAQLWDRASTTIVETGSFTTLTLGEWTHAVVNWDVVAGTDYIISVVTDRYTAQSHFFDSSIVNGHITAPIQAGMFRDLGASSTTPLMPNSQFNAGGYFIDFDFVPASAGPTLKVWDGTAEISTTVSVWDGTTEVAASLSSIV